MAKLLFYTDTSYFSGAETYFSHLILIAEKSGHQIEVVVSEKLREVTHPLWRKVVANEKVTVHYFATGSKVAVPYFFKLKKYLKKLNPDLIICNMWSPYSNTYLLLAAHSLSLPVVAIEHYFQEKRDLRYPLRPIKLLAYSLVKKIVPFVVTVSRAHQDVLRNEFGFPAHKLSILHPGMDVSLSRKSSSGEPVKLIFVGTLEERKQPEFLVEVLSLLPDFNWSLTLLGRGPLEASLKELVVTKGLEEKIKLPGWVSNVDEVLGQSDILVHPAKSENFSLTLIEAAGSSLPAIANDIGGNKEIIENGKTGLLLPLNDKQAWQKALTELITDPQKREELGRAARLKYEQHLTLEVMATKFDELINRVIR